MEQFHEQQSRQQQHQQQQQRTSGVAETETRQADEEAFDSVRQAAMVMFKQRTKDLTRLASVEAQSQKIEVELQTAQTSVAQLSHQHATLEALVEDEQQRIRQREERLAELHGALVQVDEEQRVYRRLQQAAETAIDAATTLITRFTDSEGRLCQLLALAKERVSGRSARELQSIHAQIQQRLVEATEQQKRLLGSSFLADGEGRVGISPDAVRSMEPVLETWTPLAATWARHPELSDVIDVLRDLAEWVSVAVVDPSAETEEHSPGQATSQLLPLPPSRGLSEDAFATIAEDDLQAWLEEHLLAPLQALRHVLEHLATACATHHLRLPPDATSPFTSLQERAAREWAALQAQRQAYAEAVQDAQAAADAATATVLATQTARTELQTLTETCAELEEKHLRRLSELQTGKAEELRNYSEAWRKGWCAMAALRASLLAMQHTVETRKGEAAEVEALCQREVVAHAMECTRQATSVQEEEAKLAAAEQALAEATGEKAALEKELAALQQTEEDAQRHLERLFSTARESFAPAMEEQEEKLPCNVGAAALQAVRNCPSIYLEWSAVIDAQRERFEDKGVSEAFLDALCHAVAGGSGADPLPASLLQAALQHVPAALHLPAEPFQPEVLSEDVLSKLLCLAELAREEASARTAAAAHQAFMAEAQAEMRLLRQELSSGE